MKMSSTNDKKKKQKNETVHNGSQFLFPYFAGKIDIDNNGENDDDDDDDGNSNDEVELPEDNGFVNEQLLSNLYPAVTCVLERKLVYNDKNSPLFPKLAMFAKQNIPANSELIL
jgi:hypothetical protein